MHHHHLAIFKCILFYFVLVSVCVCEFVCQFAEEIGWQFSSFITWALRLQLMLVVVLGNRQGELSGQPTVVLFVEIRTHSIA